MGPKTKLMFVLTAVAAVVWALGFFSIVHLPPVVADGSGGFAIGLGIGAVVSWTAEPTT